MQILTVNFLSWSSFKDNRMEVEVDNNSNFKVLPGAWMIL